MNKTLTLIAVAILFTGCAAQNTAEQPEPFAMYLTGDAFVPEAAGGAVEASYVHEISRRTCADFEESDSGRSRCH